jgi:nucleoside-diphosphate-sugar epimerase
MRLFCFGFGYTAAALVQRLTARDVTFAGTTRGTGGEQARSLGVEVAEFRGDTASSEVRELLVASTHVLISIPPDLEGDVVLRHHGQDVAQLDSLEWVGYLSTVGVYGDARGGWVDETSPTRPVSERSLRRVQAERAWMQFAQETRRRVEVFRLAGIYGPGRSIIDNLRSGTARRIIKPGQVFNRIHVDDIARVLNAAIDQPAQYGIYNVSDDEPAPPEDVVAYAAELLGLPAPPGISFENAGLSPMAASFWAESKRVRNDRIRHGLKIELLYPTYREGLRVLAAT